MNQGGSYYVDEAGNKRLVERTRNPGDLPVELEDSEPPDGEANTSTDDTGSDE